MDISYPGTTAPSYLSNVLAVSTATIAAGFTLATDRATSIYTTNVPNPDNPDGNGGTITINGALQTTGANILLQSSVLTAVGAGGSVTSNGGNIMLQAPGSAAVNVSNDGTISASSSNGNRGVAAVNSGEVSSNTAPIINVTGSGTLHGAEFVGFGIINPQTLQVYNSTTIPNTNAFTVGGISVSQGQPITNQIQITGSANWKLNGGL